MTFVPNSIITFTYKSKTAHSRYPHCLVLSDMNDRIHALNFDYLTDQEKANLEKLLTKSDFGEPQKMYDTKLKSTIRSIDSYRVYKKEFIFAVRVVNKHFV